MKIEEIILDSNRAFYVELPKNEYVLTVSTPKKWAKHIAKKNPTSIIINAGLFDMVKKVPLGQTIIDHNDVTITPFIVDDNGFAISEKECYPLLIDDNNNITSGSYDRKSIENSSKELAKKYKYAVCGWGLLIDNGEKTNFIEDEIRWGKDQKRRQVIGQFKDDTYFILTCDNTHYQNIYDFLSDKDVKYAYSLDGGRSSKLFVNRKQLNKKSLRPFVPTIIEFKKV